MQSGNIVLRIAVRLARFVGCFSDPPARPALTLSGQALPFVSFRASSRRASGMNAHAREQSEHRPRQHLFGISFDGRAGVLSKERS